MEGTKISFMKSIMCNEKKALKSDQIKHVEIPNYPEISVKNLYDDVMGDPEIAIYIPSRK
jgi:hypothetical protein